MLLSILRRRLPRSFAMATSAPFFKSTRGVDAARHMHGSFANSFPGSRSGEVPTSTLLLDEDIDERFVKGSGPGGQKINKVRNCVQLTHRPTGIMVSCQESRELPKNRHIARRRLAEKVEFHLKGDESKVGRRIAKLKEKKARAQRKSRLKHQGPRQVTKAHGGSAPAPEDDFEDDFGDDFQDEDGDARGRGKAAK